MKDKSRRQFLQNAGLATIASISPLAAERLTADRLAAERLTADRLSAEPERTKELFIHHVYFYLKEPNNAQHEAKLLEGLHKLAKVPTIQYVHIGKPAQTSRSVIVRDYTFSWMCFFKNIIEEEIYQTHQIHLDFIEEYSSLWEKVVVYDSVGAKKVS